MRPDIWVQAHCGKGCAGWVKPRAGGDGEGHSVGLQVREGSCPHVSPKLDERSGWDLVRGSGHGAGGASRSQGERQVESSGKANVTAKAQGQGPTSRWHFKDANLKQRQ